MANFNVVGFDDVERQMLRRSEDVEKTAAAMLEAGAKVLANAQRAELRQMARGDRSIGTLANSIAISVPKKSGDGLKQYVVVYPQGDQPHGTPRKGKSGDVSNAQVGFTLEYGTSSMPGRAWMAAANAKSAADVHEAMRKVWEEKQNG